MGVPKRWVFRLAFLLVTGALCLMLYKSNGNSRQAGGNTRYHNGDSRSENGSSQYHNGNTRKAGGSSHYDNGNSRHYEINVDDNKRLPRLRERCRELIDRGEIQKEYFDASYGNRLPFTRLLVSQEHKLIACKVGKVASTNLLRIFGFLEGVFDTQNCTSTDCIEKKFVYANTQRIFLNNLANIHGYTIQDIKIRLDKYMTFLFTREPLERLVSAYRMKPRDVNFYNFVDYILLSRLNREETGDNFEVYHQHRICRPCAIQYDFIGEMATYDRDIHTVLRNVSVLNFTFVPNREQTGYRKANSSSVVKEYYSHIPDWKIHKLWELYHVDYYLYGYDYPSQLMSAGGPDMKYGRQDEV